MKKFVLGAVCLSLPFAFLLGGCSPNKLEVVRENISEITYDYFYGKCDEFEIAISSGEREEPYSYDGQTSPKCDFALAVVRLDSTKEREMLTFSINGDAESQIFEYNIMTGTFMYDFERRFSADDVIAVKYGNTQITLDNISKEFEIDCEKAFEIGVSTFDEEISSLFEKEDFKAECYLKILDNLSNNFDNRYWCFSIVNEEGEHLNCIIDLSSGEVVAKG